MLTSVKKQNTETIARMEALADTCEQEARTIESIAHALRMYDAATWGTWTITRMPCSKPATVRVTCMEQGGTVYSIDYHARIGVPLPFDRLDVARALYHLGAVLTPLGWQYVD